MNCENCAYYMYDDDWEEYVCDAQIDEDDYQRLSQNGYRPVPTSGTVMSTRLWQNNRSRI